jgi:RNA recognition motif-containing protein
MESYKVNQSKHPLFNADLTPNLMNKNQPLFNFGLDHPIAKMQKDNFKKEEMLKMEKYSKLYGTGHAFQLCMERNALANNRREFPLKSNNFGLNISCGKYDKIEFSDFIGKDKPFDVDCSIFRQAENIYMQNN